MNIIIEILNTLATTFISAFSSLLESMFSVSNAVDSVKDNLLAIIFGVPVVFISAFGAVVLIVRVFIWLYGLMANRA